MDPTWEPGSSRRCTAPWHIAILIDWNCGILIDGRIVSKKSDTGAYAFAYCPPARCPAGGQRPGRLGTGGDLSRRAMRRTHGRNPGETRTCHGGTQLLYGASHSVTDKATQE
ncbi:hypothetical protein SAT01_29720 [Sinomonas atrocyanea]|nr:hypothetical protein SAT01_29720 [Sinomonas atrocyanea]GGG74165.1 hypothetical protein GCM10007172_28580 [Sinomonas atrocyanea]